MGIIRIPVTIDYVAQGGPAMNVFHCRTISGGGADEEQQVSECLDALERFYNAFKVYYPAASQIRMGEGMIRDPLGAPEYFKDDPRVISAGGSGGTAATLLALVVSWRTTSASRSGRGRTFIGPFNSQVAGTDGTPENAVVSLLRGAAVNLVDASTDPSGWSLGVLSQQQKVLRDWTGSSVKDRWSFMSSRRD